MKTSSISGSTQRSGRKSASLSSKAQRTPAAISLLVAIPSTDVITPAWYQMSTLLRPILPGKGRKSEASLASSKIRRSAPKKNGRHIRRNRLGCVYFDAAFLYKILTDQSRLVGGRETAAARRANSCPASAVCAGASSFRATTSYVQPKPIPSRALSATLWTTPWEPVRGIWTRVWRRWRIRLWLWRLPTASGPFFKFCSSHPGCPRWWIIVR